MEETHEPSYYEIALTNRQVVVAFVILLVCLLSAFFSGVWIGRESTSRAAAEQLVRDTPPRVAKKGQNLEELDFFSKAPAAKGGPAQQETETGAQVPSDTTLVEDLGGEPAAPTKSPATPTGESETATAQAGDQTPADEAAEARRERNKRRKERQAAKRAAAEAAARGVVPPAPSAASPSQPVRTSAPAVPKGSVIIQVFSSADRSQAESIRAKLAGGGYQAYLSPIERGGRTMYRVRVGPFASKSEAQKVADKVRTVYRLDTWVTE